MENKKRIISIMTTYFPELKNAENAKKIAAQSDLLIICDNSNENNKKIFSEMSNAIYYYFGENLGLSAAFNRVLKNSKINWRGDDYIIFFDQDSVIPQNHIYKLIKEYEELESNGYDIGCIGPVYFNTSNNKEEIPTLKKFLNKKTMQVSSIITTSMLCKYRKLKSIGFWNENVFLDMADWDICWRIHEKKMLICLTYASVIRHSIGIGEKKIGLINIRVGNPFREYYQTRDCIYLLVQSYVPIKYKIRFILMLTVRPFIHCIFLDNGKKRLKYILKGLKDVFKGYHKSLQ